MKKSFGFSTLFPLLIVLLAALFFQQAQSQQLSQSKSSSFRSYWQMGASGGTSLFFGDIKQYRYWPETTNENEWRYAGGLYLEKQFSPVFGLRGQVLTGQLAGSRRQRKLQFQSDYYELGLQSSLNINNMFARYNPSRVVNAYILLGVGLLNYDTELLDMTTKASLRKVGFGNGKGIQGRTLEGVFMGGLGLDFRLSDRLSIRLESANRIMNSDMLDASVGGFKYDAYNYSSMGISYRFGYSNRVRGSRTSLPYEGGSDSPEGPKEFIYDTPLKPDKKLDVLVIDPILKPERQAPPKTIVAPDDEKAIQEVPVQIKTEPVEVIVEVVPQMSRAFEYSVQILAKYGTQIAMNKLSNTYNIPLTELRESMHNGYYIYSVGSFSSYEAAAAKRNQLRSNNGITDAFVVAFKNGQRLDKLP